MERNVPFMNRKSEKLPVFAAFAPGKVTVQHSNETDYI
jgi:hypothetical protein